MNLDQKPLPSRPKEKRTIVFLPKPEFPVGCPPMGDWMRGFAEMKVEDFGGDQKAESAEAKQFVQLR